MNLLCSPQVLREELIPAWRQAGSDFMAVTRAGGWSSVPRCPQALQNGANVVIPAELLF